VGKLPESSKKYLFLLFLPLIGWLVYVDFYHAASQVYFVSYPYHLESGEGYVLFQTMQIKKGVFPYGAVDGNTTYLINNYPPVFHLICAMLDPLFDAPFAQGRAVTFVSTIGMCLIMGLVCYLFTSDILLSLLCGLSLPSIPALFWTQRYYRVDAPAIFLSLLGAYFFLRWLKRESRFLEYASILCFMLALYTKHNSIYAPVAAVVSLFAHNHPGKWRYLFRLGLVAVLPGLILTLSTSGRFIEHLFFYTSGGFVLNKKVAGLVFQTCMQLSAFLLPAFVIIVIYCKKLRFDRRWTFLTAYFFISVCSVVLIFIDGAWDQYLVEFAALTIITGSAALSLILRALKPPSAWIAATAACGMLLAGYVMPWNSGMPSELSNMRGFRKIFGEQKRIQKDILERVNAVPGRVLCQHINYNVLTGKNPEWNPLMSKRLAERNIISNQQIIDDIRAKKFDLIILEFYLDSLRKRVVGNEVYINLLPDPIFYAIMESYYTVPEKSHIPTHGNLADKKTVLYPRKLNHP
jgi:4-amino-4-deoxy-L-arabinose transferase-like glycosyltransferase